MRFVGIREMKAQLSAFVQRAESGEVVIITDHGRPVARLGPVEGSTALDALIEAGFAARPAQTGIRTTPVPQQTAGTVSDLVHDQRR